MWVTGRVSWTELLTGVPLDPEGERRVTGEDDEEEVLEATPCGCHD
jgi:hypothetical protein